MALLICWFNAALRAAQESLRRSESNFRSLVMNAPYGICRCNALGILQDANPALVAMFGYPAPPSSQAATWAASTPMPSNGFRLPIIFTPARNSTT